MKERPITGEEFERMIKTAPKYLPESSADSVADLMTGLWVSGRRLGEALNLSWDEWGDGIRADMTGDHVKLLIPAEAAKGGRDRVYPVTPDFAEFL